MHCVTATSLLAPNNFISAYEKINCILSIYVEFYVEVMYSTYKMLLRVHYRVVLKMADQDAVSCMTDKYSLSMT